MSKEHLGVVTPKEAVALFTEKGVNPAVVWRHMEGYGDVRGLSIDPHTLVTALLALPEDERLPPNFEDFLYRARDKSTHPEASAEERPDWEQVLAAGGAYLIGRRGDRRGAVMALLRLLDAHGELD